MSAALAIATAVLVALGMAGCGDSDGEPDGPVDGTQTGQPTITLRDEAANIGVVVPEGDGFVTLRGHIFGGTNDAIVILSHMRPNDQSVWLDFAEDLAEEGYAAVTFDFRGYGETGGEKDFNKLDDDLAAVVNYIRETGREEIFLMGASMGGTASLVVAGEEEVSGVIAVSAPAVFEGQDALAFAPDLGMPKLFIGSEDDTQAADFDELVDAAAEPKESELYPGSAHGTDLLESPHAAAFKARVLQFLKEQTGS